MRKRKSSLKLLLVVIVILGLMLCLQQSQACKRLIDEVISGQQVKRPRLMTSSEESTSYSHYGNFDLLSEDLLGSHILPQCDKNIIKVNRFFFTLVTGYSYQQIFDQGFESKPVRPVCSIVSNALILFKKCSHDIQQIPSFVWYSLMRYVADIPSQYWPHLKGTQIQILYLNSNQIKDRDMHTLGQSLQSTQVRTMYLAENQISDDGVADFGQYLQGTQVCILDLSANLISSRMETILRQMLPNIELKCEDYDYD